MEVYIMPIGSKDSVTHMNNTLLNKVDKDTVEKYIKIDNSLYEDDKINVWGLLPGERNQNTWSNFKQNDIVIFVPSKYSLIVTKILATARNKDLAGELWGNDKNGQTWELVFFVKVIGIIEKEKYSFLSELGYSKEFTLMGNTRITSRFNKAYNSISDFLDQNSEVSISPESFSEDIAEETLETVLHSKSKENNRLEHLEELADKALADNSRDYIEVKGKRIKRKAILVALVKERDNNKCKSCGFTFKKKDGKNYVEVAHIKGLGEGGPDDPKNMVALCPNCHKMLDMGGKEARNQVIENLKYNSVDVSFLENNGNK